MWFSHIHPVHSLFSVIQNDLSWLNNLFMINFQLISMSSSAENKLQMCWVTQHQCRSRQMWKISQIHPVYSLFVYNKNDYSCLKNLFMVRFQLIRMSYCAQIKLQMCWVTQRQCRSRQMWKIFTNSPSTLTFYLLQKMTCLDWTIHSWQVSTH